MVIRPSTPLGKRDLLAPMRPLASLVSSRPWLVLLAWAALVLACLYPASLAPKSLSASPGAAPHSESNAVIEALHSRFVGQEGNLVLLVVQGNAGLQAFQAGLGRVEGVSRVLTDGQLGLTSTQPSTQTSMQPSTQPSAQNQAQHLLVAQIPLGDGAAPALAHIRQYVREQAGALRVQITGGQAIADDFMHFAEYDTKRSEFGALPLTALVLLLVFGALVAAGLPLLVGVLSITVAMAGLYGLAQLTEVSLFAQSVITMLGLGAGIDYALLMVNRFREELQKGDSPRQAADRTVQTAGRSVMFSGLTVAVAMAAMILPPISYVRSLGIGGVLVVLLTVLASITALPALLALLGERVGSPRRWNLSERLGYGGHKLSQTSQRWTRFARRVLSRPWLALVGCTLILLALALPARDMKTGYAGAWGLTPGVESRDALEAVRQMGAGGLLSQFEILVEYPQRYTPAQSGPLRQLTRQLQGLDGVRAVISPFVSVEQLGQAGGLGALAELNRRSFSTDRRLVRLTVIPDQYLRADQIDPLEAKLRQTVQQSLQGSQARYLLGGSPVGEREFSRAITSAFPLAVGVVFVGTFLLLLLAFRSVVIPLKSIAMNALTVGAGYGIVTLVVQKGFLARYLGIPEDAGVLDSSLPIMLFAVMFGLSMDYEIFLLSRVQEEYLAGHRNEEAVVRAVGKTARIITAAASIMLIVFSAFMVGRVLATKSIGLGLSAAVVLDASLVRLILVPAFLKLAGRWNWWLPAWLDKILPRLRLEH